MITRSQLEVVARREGIALHAVERDSYDELVQAQLDDVTGGGDLAALLASGDTWQVD